MVDFYKGEQVRPYLKGVFHALGGLLYLILVPFLMASVPYGIKIPISFFILSIIINFISSALLHIIPWENKDLHFFRRIDHVSIFILIINSYYAVISTVIPETSYLILSIITIGTFLGIILRIFFTDISRTLIAIPYLIISWAFLCDPSFLSLLLERTFEGTLIGLCAGLFYTIGACIYMAKYPNPYPKYLGYHEVFHILSTLGNILLTIAIFNYAIPYYKSVNLIN